MVTSYLTTRDVQDLIRVDKSTIYRMAEDGRIPAVKVGRQWRFPEDAVLSWLGADPETEPLQIDRHLRQFVSPEVAGALTDLVAEALGVMVVITDMDGRPLTAVANPCGLFAAVGENPAVLPRCIDTWRRFGATHDMVPRFGPTEFGLLCARAFVRRRHQLLGMVIAGGIAPEIWPPPPDEIAAIAADLDTPAALFTEHAEEVYRLDADGRVRILALLPRVAALVSQLAEEGGRLAGTLSAIADLAAMDRRSLL